MLRSFINHLTEDERPPVIKFKTQLKLSQIRGQQNDRIQKKKVFFKESVDLLWIYVVCDFKIRKRKEVDYNMVSKIPAPPVAEMFSTQSW